MFIIQMITAVGIVLWALLYYVLTRRRFVRTKTSQDFSRARLFVLPIIVGLAFLTIFRSVNTGYDHAVYLEISNRLADIHFDQLWSLDFVNMEPLLLLLIKGCALLASGLMPFLFVTTALVLGIYQREIMRDSKIVWLSWLLVVAFCSYFFIFNGIAQMVVCALTFAGSKYLYDGKFWRYTLVVVIAALFHKTALVMLPLYFLLRFYPKNVRQKYQAIAVVSTFIIAVWLLFDLFIQFGVTYIFPEYTNNLTIFTSISPLVVARPILVLGLVYYGFRYLNMNDMKQRVWVNSAFILLIVSIFSIKFAALQRFGYFVLPYMALLIPTIIHALPTARRRHRTMVFVVVVALLYILLTNLMTTTSYNFIWEQVA